MNILILSQLRPEAVQRLRAAHDCTVAINPPELLKRQLLAMSEIVVIRSPVRMQQADFEAAPNLQLVIRAGMGTDAIDLDYASRRGVLVACVPHSANSVAEHALGLMICLLRRIPQLHRSLQEGRWEKPEAWGRELAGRRLGLLGFGRIGQRLAEVAAVLRMDIHAADRSPDRSPKREAARRTSARFVDIEQLFSECQVISIQTPLNAQTRDLVGARLLGMMQPGAILINVARGGIVNEEALYGALENGRLAGAATDVFAHEPPGSHPLLSLPNFLATPHVAAQTIDAQRRVGEQVVRIVTDFAVGRDPAPELLVVPRKATQ